MLEQTRRGLAVAGASAKVLAKHPKLLVLPLLSTFATLTTAALIGGTMSFGEHAHFNGVFFALGFIGLLAAIAFLGAFFNAALVVCVLDSFAGREVSLRHGLAGAAARSPQLFAWTLFSSVVGVLLSTVQGMLRRLGLLGAVLGGALSMSWSIVTYFVVPILVVENVGPWDAFERSKDMVKRNWGKAIAVQSGLAVLFMLTLLPVFFLIWFVNADVSAAHQQKILFGIGGSVAYFFALLAVFGALGGIFRASLYVYASTGQVPLAVEPAVLQNALRKS